MLRDWSGEGMNSVKHALVKADGDPYLAAGFLKVQGLAVHVRGGPVARYKWELARAQVTANNLRQQGVFDDSEL